MSAMVPAFAHFFSIRPWEMDRLTHGEFLQLEAEVQALLKAEGTPRGR